MPVAASFKYTLSPQFENPISIHSSPATWPPKATSPPLLIDPFIAMSNVPPAGAGSPGLTTLEIVPRLSARKSNVSPVVDGGVKEHPLQVFAPRYRSARPRHSAQRLRAVGEAENAGVKRQGTKIEGFQRKRDSDVAAFVYAEAAELSGTENAATGCGLARAHNLRELSPKPDKHAFAACGHVRGKADFTTVIDGARFEIEGEVAATWRRIIEKRYRREAVPR